MNAVYRVEMLESEAGWGQRPDGFIYGATKADVEKALKRVADTAEYSCYSRPCSDIVLVEVTEELYDKVNSKSDGPLIWTACHKHEGDLS